VCVKVKDETTTTTTPPPPPKSTSAMDSSSNSKNANDSVNPDGIQLQFEGVKQATEPARAQVAIGGRRTKRKNHIKKRKNTKRIR
jgi:hypothetical protein